MTQKIAAELPCNMYPKFSSRIDFFKVLKEDFDRGVFSWVGKFEDFALCYLSFASVLHANAESSIFPVGSFVLGQTSTGKTEFLEAVSSMFPEEIIVNLTSSSSKALYYECLNNPTYLNGKVVFVEELPALKDPELQYLLRVLLTKGRATHTTVLNGVSTRISIKGRISLQSTGLSTDALREDTMNRLVIFKSSDDEETTRKVIGKIASRYSGGYSGSASSRSELSFYCDFFKSLRPKNVIIPFAEEIEFESSNHVSRRLSRQFFDLLATVALVNQHQRDFDPIKNAVIASKKDFGFLKKITSTNLSDENNDFTECLSPCQSEVLREAERLRSSSLEITYQNLWEALSKRFDISSVKKASKKLCEIGLLKKKLHSHPVCFFLVPQASNRFGVLGIRTKF